MSEIDDNLCGDCMDGKCHGTEPDDCGCARHAASIEAVNPIDPEEPEPYTDCFDGNMSACYHCGNDCGGWQDEAGDTHPAEECEHCGCCTCTPCEYARVA